jgi:hypothetical protein
MPSIPPSGSSWNFIKKAWFLFTVAYFFMLIFDFTSSDELFPHFVYVVFRPYTNFWNWAVPWAGKNIFHLSYPITVTPNGSGDTTYNYVLQFLWITLAMLVATTWTIADHKRPSYNQLKYWVRIVMRYYFALVLFVYGFDKIIKLQFPFPDLIRLTETYGDSSPMGLAWTFIGYSKGYNIFIGGAEVLAGCLLFFKRTTLFGALVAMTVMANVAAMNFAYDIPVKIFSVNLLVLAGWIAWYDISRIVNVFFLNQPAAAAYPGMPFQTKWKKIVQSSLKTLAIILAFYATLGAAIKASKEYGEDAPKPALYGIYDTEVFVLRGDTLPPLATDTVRWKRIIVNYPRYVRVYAMSDSARWMLIAADTVKKTARFTSYTDSTKMFTLRYHEPDKNHLQFEGRIQNDSVNIVMKRYDINKFRLVSRGFHWINEGPFNR